MFDNSSDLPRSSVKATIYSEDDISHKKIQGGKLHDKIPALTKSTSLFMKF
jgi:hypothetical protein